MSKKHFSWLLASTLLVTILILLMPGRTGKESEFVARPLVPGLDSTVNDVTRVRIIGSGNSTIATLVRGKDSWTVEEHQSYPADWARLRKLLFGLAQAQVIELKTSNPDYYDRLGLKDVSDPSSTAVLVEIGEGDSMTRILLGSIAQGREGQYVRFPDDGQAMLIDRSVEASNQAADWLLRDVIDLAEAEVVDVTITQPDGETVHVSRASADVTDFTLDDIPKGREVESSWAVNALGGSLAAVLLEEVAPVDQVDWSNATRLRVLTADGVEARAEVVTVDGKSWLKLEAFPYPEQKTEPVEGATTDTAVADQLKRIEGINLRVRGWAYSIPEFKAELMSKRKDNLLKPLAKK
jgi:hypothetical protein